MIRKNPRCGCHRRRKSRAAVAACDILLVLFILVSAALVAVYLVLPRFDIRFDITVLTRTSLNGVYLAALMVLLNLSWAIYYGCHKSAAGVGLSVVTAILVAQAYGLF